MSSYYSTFTVGFEDLIEDILGDYLRNLNITLLADGLVVYETSSKIDDIRKLKFLNNSFILLKEFEDVNEHSTTKILKSLIQDKTLSETLNKHFAQRRLKFRIRTTYKNQFIAVNKDFMKNLEDKISTISRNLKADRNLPDIELMINIRTEGFALAGMQFTKKPNYEKTLEKGELNPELAHILCLLSEPTKADIFVDPFAGYGSIPTQRFGFAHKQIIANEINKNSRSILKQRLHPTIKIEGQDALNLNMLKDNSVDKIVTDPPSGVRDKINNLPKFYEQMLKEFQRILKPNGIIVILTPQKELLDELLNTQKNLRVSEEFSTLASGKKTSVYKIIKL
jgi:tRNA G10  N-methylase Trm11